MKTVKPKHVHFSPQAIAELCKRYDVTWIGDLEDASYFYQANPKTDLGHTHYLKIRRGVPVLESPGTIYLSEGSDCLKMRFNGFIDKKDREIVWSCHRHDMAYALDGRFVDGGSAYCRSNTPISHTIQVMGEYLIATVREEGFRSKEDVEAGYKVATELRGLPCVIRRWFMGKHGWWLVDPRYEYEQSLIPRWKVLA